VRHNSAEDTSKVTRGEHNRELSSLRVGLLGGSEDVSVEGSHDVLEGAKLDHGVGNLSHPQRAETLVETVPALVGLDGVETLKEAGGEVGGLHSDLDGFKGSEEGVSDDLSAGGGSKETKGLVLSSLGSESPLVDVLEHLVETELSEALSRVAEEGCVPSDGEALKTLGSVDGLETIGDALVKSRVSLKIKLVRVQLYDIV